MGSSSSHAAALVSDISNGDEKKREAALRSMCESAGTYEEKRTEFVEAGAVIKLVDLLKDKDSDELTKELAAAALGHLAMHPDAKIEIREASGIEPLVKLAKDSNKGCRGAAATALSSLASKSPENQSQIADAGGVEALVSIVSDKGNACQVRCWAAAGLGNMALQHEANQKSINKSGGIEAVCDLLKLVVPKVPYQEPVTGMFARCGGCKKRNPTIKADLDCTEKAKVFLVRSLSSLGYNCDVNQGKIAKAGAYEPLVEMIKAEDTYTRMESINALCNLVGNSPENQTGAGKAGVIPVVVTELKHDGTSLNRKAKCTGLLATLAANAHKKNVEMIDAEEAIPSIVWQMHTGTEESKLYAAMLIGTMAEVSKEMQSKLGENQAALGLGKLVEGGNAQQRHWSAKAIMALAKDHPENRARIEEHGGALPSDQALASMRTEGMKLSRVTEDEQANDAVSAGPDLPPHLAAKAAAASESQAGKDANDAPALGSEGPRKRGSAGGED